MNSDKKVLLVFPGKLGAFKPEIPVQLLYLAAALRERDFPCEIFDMRLQDLRECDLSRTLCVGITSISGSMIKYGLEFAGAVRSYDPDIPIIWGGPHASLLPEQTVEDDNVDIVVSAEGESTLLELVERMSNDEPFIDVAGITLMKNGDILSTPPRPFIEMDPLPIELPYDLLEMDRYELSIFPVHTSRGCPFKCTFCYNQGFNRGSYRCKSAERVLAEVDYLVDRFPIKKLSFACEDNFFVKRRRVEEICRGLLDRDYGIKWEAFCRFDTFCGYSDDFIRLLEQSGCSMLSFGGESGNQEMLDRVIEKGTTVEQIIEGTARMAGTGITQMVSFMCGIPTETRADLEMTMDLIDRLMDVNPQLQIVGVVFYTPFPGNKLFKKVVNEFDFDPPASLEDWADYKILRDVRCTWLPGKRARALQKLSIMTRFPFYTDHPKVPERLSQLPYRPLYRILAYLARWRWKHRFFKFPIEWIIVEKVVERIRGFV